MSAPSIFVSYAHADADALKQLKKHFAPLEREGLARLWADEAIDFGADWDEEIVAALDGCRYVVPVLSAAFFASKYIAEKEIPRLLERQGRGEIEILPIFWSPGAEPEFPQTQSNGEIVKRRLSDWQGLGRPSETLKEVAWAERERALAKFAESLRRKLGKATPTPAVTASSSSTSTRADGRVAITVELRREGAQLLVSFRRPGEKPFVSRKLDWATFEPKAQGWNDVLDNYARPKLEAWIAEASAAGGTGQQLLELLFGDATSSRPILDELFRHKNANYTWRPVDLRIVSDEPSLARLPWRLLAHNGRFLIDDGWTVVLGREVEPSAHVQIDSRREVLIAAAGDDAGLAETLAAFLRERWEIPKEDGRLRISRSAKDLRWAFRGMNPQMVILTGECSGNELLFSDGKLTLAELAALAAAEVMVAACAPVQLEAISCLGKMLLFPRLEEKGLLFGERFLLLFQNLLVDLLDPPSAVHRLHDKKAAPAPDLATWCLCADYASWSAPVGHKAPSKTTKLLLDRIEQKNVAAGLCWDLAKPESVHKVLVILAHAGPGAAVAQHADQLFATLQQKYGNQIALQKAKLDIAWLIPDIPRQVQDNIVALFGAPGSTLAQAIKAIELKGPNSRERPIIFLDCGTNISSAAEICSRLFELLAFADGALLSACPLDRRIVLFLALDLSAEALATFKASLPEFEKEVALKRGCELLILPELHLVPFRELRAYLENQTDCPDPTRAAKAITAVAGGEFDRTVELIEEGERGWLVLLNKLEKVIKDGKK